MRKACRESQKKENGVTNRYPMPSRGRYCNTISGRHETYPKRERRSGVLPILPEYRRIITALPGELRQQQNQGGGMEGGRHMSVKIRVSYTDDEELAGVIRLLSPLGKKWKVAKNQKGKYKKAYTEEHRGNGENNEDK